MAPWDDCLGFVDPAYPVDWDHPLNRGGLVLWWAGPPGYSGVGDQARDLTGRNHGALSNGVTWGSAAGQLDPVLTFPGSGSRVTGPSAGSSPTLGLTVAVWVRTSQATQGAIWSSRDAALGDGFTLQVGGTAVSSSAGTVGWFCDCDSVDIGCRTTSATINDGNWRHVVGTWNPGAAANVANSQFAVFVDGVPITSLTTTSTGSKAIPVTQGLHLAGWTANAVSLVGGVRDLLVFPRVLSAAEVRAHYLLSRPGYRTPDSPLNWAQSRAWEVATSPPPPPPAAGYVIGGGVGALLIGG